MVIVSLTSIVLNAEEQINKDIIDLRINITVILKDIEDNCSGILVKFPNLVNVPSILSTCWRVHDYYRYAKIVVAMLIIHDSFSAYVVSGGPMSYLIISVCIGLLSILAVYVSQMGLILIIDFAYVAMGTIIIFILNNTCFTPMPPETLHLS